MRKRLLKLSIGIVYFIFREIGIGAIIDQKIQLKLYFFIGKEKK